MKRVGFSSLSPVTKRIYGKQWLYGYNVIAAAHSKHDALDAILVFVAALLELVVEVYIVVAIVAASSVLPIEEYVVDLLMVMMCDVLLS